MNEPFKPPDGESRPAPRRSFLLRLWCSNSEGPICWQASLEDSHTGERIGFANLELLFAYLMELTEGNGTREKDRRAKPDRPAGTRDSNRN